MYSQKKIDAKLEAFAAKEGWMPTRRTQAEVDEFCAYVKSIVKFRSDSKGSWVESIAPVSQKRGKEISKWIENEQILCAVDSRYFEDRYAYIRNECGEIKKFLNSKSQEIIDSVLADLEEIGFGINLILLHSRQCGSGTKILLKSLHRALFVPNTEVSIMSSVSAKTDYLKQGIDICYDNLPFWLIPLKISRDGFTNQSHQRFYSGSRPSTGVTHTCVFIPDASDFPNPMRTIEEGILPSIYSSPSTFLVLRGTKEGSTDWFSNLYMYSKKYWPEGHSRFFPLFIPWMMASDRIPSAEWLRRYPIAKGWKPMRETLEQATAAETFIHSAPALCKIAGADWSMSREQKWFWEFNYKEAKSRQTLESFTRKFPPNDEFATIVPFLPDATKETDADIDFDELFPNPQKMQEKAARL